MKKKSLIVLFVCLLIKVCAQTDTLSNIETFGRIWGMVKFYHPTVQKNKIDWNNVFLKKYTYFKNASNQNEYNLLVKNLFDTLGQISTSSKPYKYFPKDTTICNLNFNWIDFNTTLDYKNKQYLKNLIIFYKPQKNKSIEKENIKGYNMKLVSWKDIKLYPNESTCMLALFNYWNRINYCYAYKNLMDIPWDKTLTEFIIRIKNASGSKEFYMQMAELITRINDGHGWCVNKVVYDEIGSSMKIPIEYVEGKNIVSSINDSLSQFLGINCGDEILEVNGITMDERRKYLDKYIGGSNIKSSDLVKNLLIIGIKNFGSYKIKVKDTLGIERMLYFRCDTVFNLKLNYYSKFNTKEFPYKLLSNSYGYIDAGITSKRNIKKAFNKFRNTKAIIIDHRKYGGGNRHLYVQYLTNKNPSYAIYYASNPKFFGTYKKLIFQSNFLRLSCFKRKYKGKIIVLIDEHTASSMEFRTMCIQSTGKIVLIGRNTGGYDGSCAPFLIQPDFGTAYTEDAVFYPDGKQTQRIGIVPDIYVSKTYEGVKRGKDEILEKAIQYLNETVK